jgi:hypothetical protein
MVIVSTFRRIRLGVYAVLLVAVSLAVLGLGAIQAQQWYLRYRSERLLADIRALELRKSTFEDAQRLYETWRKGAHYEGTCSRETCRLQVEFDDFTWNHAEFFSRYPRLFRVYHAVGGRAAKVIAAVSVRKGLIWTKNFSVSVEAPMDNSWRHGTYTLVGSAETVSRFANFGHIRPDLLVHPEYEVGKPGGCEVCLAVWANFTPYAEASDINRLMTYDLSCLTRLSSPCLVQEDLMPEAWNQLMREEGHDWPNVPCSSQTTALLGRDAENVAAVAISRRKNEESESTTTVRLVTMLKATRTTWSHPEAALNQPVEADELKAFQNGEKILLFFSSSKFAPMNVYQCGAVPLNDQNLALAGKGIAQDWKAGETPDE